MIIYTPRSIIIIINYNTNTHTHKLALFHQFWMGKQELRRALKIKKKKRPLHTRALYKYEGNLAQHPFDQITFLKGSRTPLRSPSHLPTRNPSSPTVIAVTDTLVFREEQKSGAALRMRLIESSSRHLSRRVL